MTPPKNLTKMGSQYIAQHIEHIERDHHQRLAAQQMLGRNMLVAIPPRLQRRVDRIMAAAELQRIVEERLKVPEKSAAELEEGTEEPPANGENELKPFNPSTMSFVADLDLQHETLQLDIEPPPEKRRPQTKTVNWMANMFRQKRADRICWPTKLYHFDKKFSQKSLFEQAEQMMVLGAESFAEWLANLGNDREMTLSTELIMQLFSIGIEGDAAKALYVEPQPRKAVPLEVAHNLQMPHLSIEYNVQRLQRSDERQRRRQIPRRHAFGRSLSPPRIVERPDAINVTPVEPNFPDAMRTKRTIFDGITHLRSTKGLVQQMMGDPRMSRPEFLVESGCFRAARDAGAGVQERPLYAYFVKDRTM